MKYQNSDHDVSSGSEAVSHLPLTQEHDSSSPLTSKTLGHPIPIQSSSSQQYRDQKNYLSCQPEAKYQTISCQNDNLREQHSQGIHRDERNKRSRTDHANLEMHQDAHFLSHEKHTLHHPIAPILGDGVPCGHARFCMARPSSPATPCPSNSPQNSRDSLRAVSSDDILRRATGSLKSFESGTTRSPTRHRDSQTGRRARDNEVSNSMTRDQELPPSNTAEDDGVYAVHGNRRYYCTYKDEGDGDGENALAVLMRVQALIPVKMSSRYIQACGEKDIETGRVRETVKRSSTAKTTTAEVTNSTASGSTNTQSKLFPSHSDLVPYKIASRDCIFEAKYPLLLLLAGVISPFLTIPFILVIWVAASFWGFSIILSDSDDGRAFVLAVRDFWVNLMMKMIALRRCS
ncbi:hypothetical protein KEM54_005428 [Ascosphaera aggregata]|nr:hypothetical protein KEM54_005428 [Ascosphaera aggregata]